MDPASAVTRCLQAVLNHTGACAPPPPLDGEPLLFLPDGTTKSPAYPLLTLSAPVLDSEHGQKTPSSVALEDCWTGVYGLFTLFQTQEYIPAPAVLGALGNTIEIRAYLLTSGLARVRLAHPSLSPSTAASSTS